MKNLNNVQKKLNKQNGSISLFVLLSLLFFLIIVVSVGVSLRNKESTVNKQYQVVKNNYEKDVGNEDAIYEQKLATIPHNVTVYFQKGKKWVYNSVYAYVWKNNEDGTTEAYKEWPGEPMQIVDSTNGIYKYNVPAEFYGKNIVFNVDEISQTVDLTMPLEDGYIFKVRDANSCRTLYFCANWTNQINIHMWGNGVNTDWPGVKMEYVKAIGNTLYYKYELPEQYQKFLFVEVINNSPTGQQTRDIEFEGGDMLYRGYSASPLIYSDGTWEKYNFNE